MSELSFGSAKIVIFSFFYKFINILLEFINILSNERFCLLIVSEFSIIKVKSLRIKKCEPAGHLNMAVLDGEPASSLKIRSNV
jgi:hypothetical protein